MIVISNTGKITAYQAVCGAVQRIELKQYAHHEPVCIDLWIEHGTYHVRAHDHELHGRLFWDSFDTITAARTRYSKAVKDTKAAMKAGTFNLAGE